MNGGLVEAIVEGTQRRAEEAERRGFLRGLEAAETIISNAQYLGKGARDPLLDAIRALKTTSQEG